MDAIKHIFAKEFRAYFTSPVAYIIISIFLVVTGWFFFLTFFLYNQAELRGFFVLLPIICAFFVPAITMRQFSEEFNTGSFELLMTMPVSTTDIVVGKFLAATAFSAVMLAPTIFYAVSVSLLGDLDWGAAFGGYLGAVLLCASFSAIGLLASSFTKNQIVSFVVGMAVCVALTLIDKMLFFLPEHALAFFQFLGTDAHFQSIAKGIVDTRDILYFLSVSFLALYGTGIVVQQRK